MSEETKRPRGGEGAAPFAMRARNRTMVMDSDKMDSLRSQMERPEKVTPSAGATADEASVDASSLDVFGGDDYAAPQIASDSGFKDLDDIFGVSANSNDTTVRNDALDPFAFDDVEPAAPAAPPIEEPTVASDSTDTSNLSTARQPTADAPFPPSRLVRSVPAMTTPPKTPPAPVEEDIFDPFASMEESPIPSESPSQTFGLGDQLDSVFGELPTMEEVPVVPSTQSVAPKIVRPGELGAAHERVIIPPPPPQAPPIHIPVVAPAPAANEPQQAPREVEAMTEPRDHIHWKVESPLVGFLVTYDHDPKGSYVELRQGRLMVSNQREESGSCLVVLGESISPMHAIMRVASGGVVQVLDQLSEAGTRVRHMGQQDEEFLSGEKSTVSHGDIIFFGDRKFHVLLVVGEEEQE